MIELLQGFPPNVIGIEATGRVTSDDYERTLAPTIEEKQRQYDKIRLIYVLGPDFDSYTAGAMWDDSKLAFEHPRSWEKIAVVSDHEWLNRAMSAFSWMVPGEFRLFHDSELDAAKDWVSN
jgi:hypothetical protein